MIQFNLLPDVKVQYIKGQRMKRLVVLASIAAASVGVGLVLITFAFSATQKNHMTNLDKDIQNLVREIEETPELDRILSVQNQLGALPQLYDGRPAINRMPGFIDQTTPEGVRISRYSIDFAESKVEITGLANSLELVNSFVDTIKYTNFSYIDEKDQTINANAHSEVVLIRFGRDKDEATYTLSFKFDPLIYDKTKSITLNVPTLQTTGAAPPNAIFVEPTQEEGN